MIDPVNKRLLDLFIRHGVFIERYKTGQVNKIMAMFNNDVLPDIERLLYKHLTKDTITAANVRALSADLKILTGAYALMNDKLGAELVKLAISDADWLAAVVRNTVPLDINFTLPSPAQLEAIASKTYVRGALVKDWFAGLDVGVRDKITQQVNIGMVEGESIDQIVRRIKGTQAANYSDGILNIERRNLEAVVRTSIAGVNNSVREEVYAENSDVISGEFWDATLDMSTCQACAALDKQEFEIGEGPQPPLHWNCLLPDNIVYADDMQAAHKVKYSGQVCEFGLADGRRFTTTKNHMLLTPWGFARADSLCEGDYVIDCLEFNTPTSNPNNHNSPARIDNIFESLSKSSKVFSVTVPNSPEYLHGDGRFCDGNIEIVTSDSLLTNNIETLSGKFIGEHLFAANYSDITGFSCLSNLNSMLLGLREATDGGVGIRCESEAFLCRHVGHSDEAGLGNGANMNSCMDKSGVDSGTVNIETVGDGQDRFAGIIPPNNFCGIDNMPAPASLNIVSFQNSIKGSLSNFERIHNVLKGHSRMVKFARITFKGNYSFTGHVYDLQSLATLYTVNGIVSSNCRCVRLPTIKSWKALGIDLKEAPPSTRASMDGQVPASMTYARWLKGQSIESQNEVLGVGKAQIFRRGELPLDRFIDARNRPLTLGQLTKLEEQLGNN